MQIAARKSPPEAAGFWDRPLSVTLPISREVAIYAALFVVAALLRVWDLGPRMLHHDESLHATYSYYLYTGRGYRHDPMMHGPWQFTAMAFTYFLFGASELTARLPHAMFGSVLTVLPFLIRGYIGRAGAFAAAVLLCVSPSFLYFTRFAREDAFVVTWTALAVIALVRFLDARQDRWLYVFAAAVALGFCTKENTYITVGIVGLYLLLVSVIRHRGELLSVFGRKPALSAEGDALVLLGTLVLPLFAGFGLLPLRLFGLAGAQQTMFLSAVLAVLVVVSAMVGLNWDRRRWVRAAALFWGIFVVLHTTFFTNPGGIYSGTVGALTYWIEQQGVARGEQPWYYYFLIVPLYEFVAVGVGLAGIVYWLRRGWSRAQGLIIPFLIFWIAVSQIVYGYTSEKMPWLVVHLALPFTLLAGATIGQLIEKTDWRAAARSGGVAFAVGLALSFAALSALIWRPLPLGQDLATSLAQQRIADWIGGLIALALTGGLTYHVGRRLVGPARRQIAVATVLAIAMAFSIRAAWQASYYHGDVPVEMLVYTQTTRDIGEVMRQVEDLTYRTGATKETFKVAYDSGVSWPMEWYFREYRARNFYGSGTPAADAPIVLASFENGTESRVRAFLGNRYVSQRYRLRAWFDESSYRGIREDPGVLLRAFVDSEARDRLWKFLLYREPLKPSGSTDFVVFVRRDLARGPWAAPLAAQPGVDEAAWLAKERQVPIAAAFGSRGSEVGQLLNPRGIAVAPDGSVYVADSGNHRIQRFDAAGRPIAAFGGPGAAEGQFNEPWGVAVDKQGTVYVADTWNHRVQVFDSTGRLVGVWGQPGVLFGPRSIAILPSGNVLVSDTGHHRVVVFDPRGTMVGEIGGRGAGEGLFSEPVGLAVDESGNFYVADTWNRRVQKFDSSLKSVAQWAVVGWESESILNKPYLAVDAEGAIYLSDPEGHRLAKLGANGQIQAVWGQPRADGDGLNMPIGVAVGDAGTVYAVDSLNGRVVRYAEVR